MTGILTVFLIFLQNYICESQPREGQSSSFFGSNSAFETDPILTKNPFDDPFFKKISSSDHSTFSTNPFDDPFFKKLSSSDHSTFNTNPFQNDAFFQKDPFKNDAFFQKDPFKNDAFFQSDPFKNDAFFQNDPFKNDPFFTKTSSPKKLLLPSILLDSTTDKSSASSSSSSSNSDEGDVMLCPNCKKGKKKKPNKGTTSNFNPNSDPQTHVIAVVHSGPTNIPISSSFHPPSNYYTSSFQPPPSPSYSTSNYNPSPSHSPSSYYSTPTTVKPPTSYKPSPSNSESSWPVATGAFVGGAAAGGLLASAASKPTKPTKPSKPPVHASHQNNQKPATNIAQGPKKCSYCIREHCNPGSCREAPDFDATKDAEALQKAVSGIGTDESTLIKILTQRSDEQIEMIRQEYVRCGRTMSSDIEGDTSFKTKQLLDALVTPRSLFYAEELERAFKKGDTDTMIEIFTSLSDCAIREVSSEYSKRFRKALPESIEKKTCLDFENFLLELAKGNRQQNQKVDVAAAKKDANALLKAGVNKWFGTNEKLFINIFATRSWTQLKEILKQYDLKRSSGIVHDIKSETSGKLQKGLLTLVKNIRDQSGFFADELEKSLDSLILPVPGDNNKLIRIMRGRCGVDLGDIRDAYPKKHKGKKLASRISGKTYMDYETALLAMITK